MRGKAYARACVQALDDLFCKRISRAQFERLMEALRPANEDGPKRPEKPGASRPLPFGPRDQAAYGE